MIIDTTDPAILEIMNPLERQVLHALTDRLAMLAWQRRGWTSEMPAAALPPQAAAEPPRDGQAGS